VSSCRRGGRSECRCCGCCSCRGWYRGWSMRSCRRCRWSKCSRWCCCGCVSGSRCWCRRKRGCWSWCVSSGRCRSRRESCSWSRCGWRCYRGIHVALDLSDAQRPVVNPDLIYSPRKILTVNAIPADLQRIRRGRNSTRLRPTGYLHAVHIQPHRRPIIRRRQMRPGIHCQRQGPIERTRRRAPHCRQT